MESSDSFMDRGLEAGAQPPQVVIDPVQQGYERRVYGTRSCVGRANLGSSAAVATEENNGKISSGVLSGKRTRGLYKTKKSRGSSLASAAKRCVVATCLSGEALDDCAGGVDVSHPVAASGIEEHEDWLSGRERGKALAELDVDLIKQAKIFHYGSISLIEETCRSSHMAAMRIAKDSGCILSYDPNLRLPLWPSEDAARKSIMKLWDQADIIKISEEEITFLTNGVDPYDDDVVLKKLFHPNLKLLLVSEGAQGCRYYTQHFKGRVEGLKVKAVDTTGGW